MDGAARVLLLKHRKIYRKEVRAALYWQLMRDYDDICQETLLRSFEILHKYHGKCRFASWVAKISFYIISHRIREIKRGKEDLMNIEDFDVYVTYRNQ